MEETRKKVVVDYSVEDHAAGPLGRIAAHGEHAGHAVEGLKERVRELRTESLAMAAGALGVGVGFGALIEKVKEANVEFGAAQKSIASTTTAILDWPKSMSAVDRFTASMKLARGATKELEEAAAKFNMQLPDVAAAYKTIGISAAPLGLTQKQWMDLAVKSAAAAKQFGISGEEAANTIGKALVSKSIRASSDLGKFLYQNVGGNLHKLNNAQILARMDKALGQSTEIAKKMGEGFGGSINRIQTTVNELTRQLTGPLFAAIGQSLDGVAQKLQQVGEDGQPLLETYAKKLVEAFEVMKQATGFILDHWKQIAAVWAGMKAAGAITSLAGSAAGGAGGLAGAVKGAGIPLAGAALGLAFESKVARDSQERGFRDTLAGGRGIVSDLSRIQELKEQMAGIPLSERANGTNETRAINREVVEKMQSIADAMHARGIAGTEGYKGLGLAGAAAGLGDQGTIAALGVNTQKLAALSDLMNQIVYKKGILDWSTAAGPEDAIKSLKTTGKPQINFTGENHFDFKFEDTDPDRVFLRFQEGFENQLVRRTASTLAEPLAD